MLYVSVATAALIAVILLVVYRSVFTALLPPLVNWAEPGRRSRGALRANLQLREQQG